MNNIKYLIIFLLALSFLFFSPSSADIHAQDLKGRILIQVEENGEAWYVYPKDLHRYYLGRPDDAFNIMRELSLGATSEFISQDVFPERLAGYILLDVEKNGEAYYIHPDTLNKHYLNRPSDAFSIMREFGLGVTNHTLASVFENNTEKEDLADTYIYINDVPFTSQAPYGNWSDQRQQDGCEEASALMAVRWARNESLSREEALAEITGSSDYILERYGEYRDVSVDDTINWIFKDYFNFSNVEVKHDITVDDIIHELEKGNLVITPMNGQIMYNPNFTPPGPPRHMIVILGYDPERSVFITHDPGTRNGEDYEYDSRNLFASIRDYPTGYHEEIDTVTKSMIIVKK